MLFTRTIRSKMITGLSLILIMLVILILSGIPGLDSHRNTVRDMSRDIKMMPRRANLNRSVALLFKPLLMRISNTKEAAHLQQQEFAKGLQDVRDSIVTFRQRYEELPQSPNVQRRKEFVNSQLYDIDQRLARLDKMQVSLREPAKRNLILYQMIAEVGQLEVLVQQIPNSQLSMNQLLDRAHRSYKVRFWWVSGTSAFAAFLFLMLARYSYYHVYCPITKLHSGARRVANGDFGYRVDLGDADDEMSELAEDFNKMTARLLEKSENLEQQVRMQFDQLTRSERLAGIGFLSAGVAHEINNPLSAITMASESILNTLNSTSNKPSLEDCEVMQEYMKMIQIESSRCVTITRKLKEFARGGGEDERREVDLREIIQEVLSMVSHMKQYDNRKIIFDDKVPSYILANRAEIKQVVLNLIANGLEAMEGGEGLTISICEQIDTVTLTFEDEGCGMTSEVLEHLFDPFFTSRKSGKGTGLGMSISNRIVSDHGGTLEVASPGKEQGSTVTLQLPKKGEVVRNAA